MHQVKRAAVAALAACSLGLFAAGPASAQNMQEGLVNVALEDITVQLPITLAANVCDLNVAVIAEIADQGGECTATADSVASAGPSGNGSTRQEGLVNVLVDDVVVQAPIALAANICDVNVAVIAEVADDQAVCNADANSDATLDSPPTPGGGGGGATNIQLPIDLDLGGTLTELDNDPLIQTPFLG
jgi:hypothetical protein